MADTRHLNAAQHGAYLLLLMTAWRMPDCKLPNDDVFLSRCASMDVRTWKSNKDLILAFWKNDDEGKLYQRRLLDERKYVEDVRNKNARAGKSSALKNKERHSTTVITKLQPNFNPHTHTLPLEETVSKDTGSAHSEINTQSIIFGSCLAWLAKATGKDANSLRSVVGKWRKDGDAQLIEAFIKAQKENPLDPVSFIVGCLKPKNYSKLPSPEKPNRTGVKVV